ncbi:MAG: DUF951 domain-containing protein [Lachnospiraceae bacterium]|nr:DUF951 domain-containing protein [Lachnospiraceae bacterium]
MDIKVGDILQLKKQHPCGSKEWEVLRVGADFRLKCMGCGHQIMIPRRQVEKNVKKIILPNSSEDSTMGSVSKTTE